MSLRYVRDALDPMYEQFRHMDHYNEDYELYCQTVPMKWEYKRKRPYKKDVRTEHRRVYLHFYYNIEKAAEDEKKLDRKLLQWRKELENNQRQPAHETKYNTNTTLKSP